MLFRSSAFLSNFALSVDKMLPGRVLLSALLALGSVNALSTSVAECVAWFFFFHVV